MAQERFDVVIIGAGAAGMMCAIEAGRRGRSVLIVDHARAPGEKIRISGGGRCNFTNTGVTPAAFISQNPRFCISALSRYTPKSFIALVERHGIAWHEKTLGQLFCDGSATQIVAMLVAEMHETGTDLRLGTAVSDIRKVADGFVLSGPNGVIACNALVIATGGKSIPKMGATGLGYDVAQQFGLRIVPTRPGLVPLTFEPSLLGMTSALAGVAVDTRVSFGKTKFDEAMLFTHRGLSGPAILQISSYWQAGKEIQIDLLPRQDLAAILNDARRTLGRQSAHTLLGRYLPQRLATQITQRAAASGTLGDATKGVLDAMVEAVKAWRIRPAGSEGYRTAEVTVGGVDTRDLESKTLGSKSVPGLYFIGEAVDVTGWLGGYNFQWAWASGWCAGQVA